MAWGRAEMRCMCHSDVRKALSKSHNKCNRTKLVWLSFSGNKINSLFAIDGTNALEEEKMYLVCSNVSDRLRGFHLPRRSSKPPKVKMKMITPRRSNHHGTDINKMKNVYVSVRGKPTA